MSCFRPETRNAEPAAIISRSDVTRVVVSHTHTHTHWMLRRIFVLACYCCVVLVVLDTINRRCILLNVVLNGIGGHRLGFTCFDPAGIRASSGFRLSLRPPCLTNASSMTSSRQVYPYALLLSLSSTRLPGFYGAARFPARCWPELLAAHLWRPLWSLNWMEPIWLMAGFRAAEVD